MNRTDNTQKYPLRRVGPLKGLYEKIKLDKQIIKHEINFFNIDLIKNQRFQ
ncbi:hypothetical protein IGI96_000889 [Enterococcus sp. DIV0421]